jgi:glucan phosphoethanolaminetransferase (alkaline phosphatase superfamily)
MIIALINLIVWLVVVGILYWLVLWIIDAIPIPDPPARMIKIVLMVLLVIVVILLLLNLIGVQTGMDLPRIGNP